MAGARAASGRGWPCRRWSSPKRRGLGDEANFGGRSEYGRITAPVDEGAADAAVTKVGPSSSHPPFVKHEELGVGHFARGHREHAMRATCHVARYFHVVGLVGQDKPRKLAPVRQPPEGFGVGRAATD